MPFAIDSLGRVAFTTDPSVQIEQHLMLVLGTQLGERFMRPDYGLDSQGYLFGSLDEVAAQRLQIEIEHALTNWEPAIIVRAISVLPDRENNTLQVTVDFSLQVAQAGVQTDTVHTATINLGGAVVSSRA